MTPSTVLIVDDDEDTRLRMAAMVRKEAFTVVTANDGDQGLEVFRRGTPPIVITDYHMPGRNGLQLIEAIQALAPKTHVILVTAYDDPAITTGARQAGVLAHLKKPIDVAALIGALDHARGTTKESTDD